MCHEMEAGLEAVSTYNADIVCITKKDAYNNNLIHDC